MDEKYRLVFRGEIQDDQHPAVVKRRLLDLLKLSGQQLDKLFSGEPVIIGRNVDRVTATKYQAQFRQAGCRLRVLAEPGAANQPVAEDPAATKQAPATSEVTARADDHAEAPTPEAQESQQPSSLTALTGYVPPAPAPQQEIQAPDFGVAEVGARILEIVEDDHVFVRVPEFQLAEVGADLLTTPRPVHAVKIGELKFELAEVGTDIGPSRPTPAVEAPDVSHLQLQEMQG